MNKYGLHGTFSKLFYLYIIIFICYLSFLTKDLKACYTNKFINCIHGEPLVWHFIGTITLGFIQSDSVLKNRT